MPLRHTWIRRVGAERFPGGPSWSPKEPITCLHGTIRLHGTILPHSADWSSTLSVALALPKPAGGAETQKRRLELNEIAQPYTTLLVLASLLLQLSSNVRYK